MTDENVQINPDNDVFYSRFEPKAQNRFICYVKDPKETDPNKQLIPAYLIKRVSRPSLSKALVSDGGELKWKWLWDSLTMYLYDPIVPSAAKIMQSYVESSVPFNIIIKVLCSIGDVVEEWQITNAEVIGIDYGTLDWGTKGDPVDIRLTIKFEHAKLIF